MDEEIANDTERRDWRRVTIALFLLALVAGFAPYGAVASLDDVARHFGHHAATKTIQSVVGLSGSQLGIGLAVLRVASLGAMPLASLADRWGRTKILRRTLVVGLVITAAAALSPTYWFFVALLRARAALALEHVDAGHRGHGRALEYPGPHRPAGHRVAGAGIGAGLAAVLHGLIRGPDSFRWLFALALVPVFFLRRLFDRVPEPTYRNAAAPLARLGAVPRVGRPRLIIVGVLVFVIGVITGPAGGFTFVYGEGVLKIRPDVVSLVVALSGLTGLLGLLLSRYLARAAGRRWTVVIGTIATALTACVAYGGGKTAFIVGYMSGVAAGGLLAPAIAALSTELLPIRSARRRPVGSWSRGSSGRSSDSWSSA